MSDNAKLYIFPTYDLRCQQNFGLPMGAKSKMQTCMYQV